MYSLIHLCFEEKHKEEELWYILPPSGNHYKKKGLLSSSSSYMCIPFFNTMRSHAVLLPAFLTQCYRTVNIFLHIFIV